MTRIFQLLTIALLLFHFAPTAQAAPSSGCTALNGFQVVLNGDLTIPQVVTLAQGEIITVTLQTPPNATFQDFSLIAQPTGGTPQTVFGTATTGTFTVAMPFDFTGLLTLSGNFTALSVSATCAEPAADADAPAPPAASFTVGGNEAALFLNTDADGNPAYHVYVIEGGNGTFALDITQDDLAPYVGNPPTTNTEIETSGIVALYALSSGEFQLNVGPDEEGKTFVLIFDSIPPSTVSSYVIEP